MTHIAVLGSAFGDEGKGRVVHDFSCKYDWVVRFNGGANAGHTIYRDGKKYVHNLIPSFDWRSPRTKAYLASGMVIDLQQLHKEVSALYQLSKDYSSRVFVDTDAFVVLQEHKEEDAKTNGHIGSTNRGIGPAYKAKIGRQGVRICDILGKKSDENYKLISEMKEMGVVFTNILKSYSNLKNSSIIFEGAQGVLLDINHGTYPYVSCSDATVAGIYASGFNFAALDKVYGVSKCYSTRVGEGPFPTELVHGELSTKIREDGQEYGATTGRSRRIGWLDLPALKYACLKGGFSHLILTKLDILNGMSEVPVCTEYEVEPTCPGDFFDVKPKYKNVVGWKDGGNFHEILPFIELVEKTVGRSVRFVTHGLDSKDIISL